MSQRFVPSHSEGLFVDITLLNSVILVMKDNSELQQGCWKCVNRISFFYDVVRKYLKMKMKTEWLNLNDSCCNKLCKQTRGMKVKLLFYSMTLLRHQWNNVSFSRTSWWHVQDILCVSDFHSKYHLDSIIFLTKANYPTWSDLMNISQTRKAWNIWHDLQTNAYACFQLLVGISKGWALMVWSDGLTFVQKVTAVSLSKHQ